MIRFLVIASLASTLFGCVSEGAHDRQWNSRTQIWIADLSQVRVRAAQSRTLETSDKSAVLQAVVQTFQDLGFRVNVLDADLGIVSGRKYVDLADGTATDPTYSLYDPENLMVFNDAFRTWGPFRNRQELVRLTVTVRPRNQEQLVVRAAAQFSLRPVEDPGPYQSFFATLEKALFLERQRG